MRKVVVYPQSPAFSPVKRAVPVAAKPPATKGTPRTGAVGKMGGFAGAKKVGLSHGASGTKAAVRGKTGR